MDMKDVYAALEKLDNGADLITAIKGEINTLNNEAKKNRIAGEHTAEKLKNVLAGLNLEDADDVADKAKNLKAMPLHGRRWQAGSRRAGSYRQRWKRHSRSRLDRTANDPSASKPSR